MLSMFNNPKYSDVTIQLNSGVLYAHRVVLDCMSDVMSIMIDYATRELKEADKPVLNFTDYTDEAVIRVIRHTYDDKLIEFKDHNEWREMLYLSHYLNYKKIMNELAVNHNIESVSLMIEIGSELNITQLFIDAADLAFREIMHSDDISGIISDLLSINWDNFKKLHRYWPDRNFNLFMLDCFYCDQHYIAIDAVNHLSELITDINFHQFVHCELKTCLTFHILNDNAIGNCIRCFEILASKQRSGFAPELKKNIASFICSNMDGTVKPNQQVVLTEKNIGDLII